MTRPKGHPPPFPADRAAAEQAELSAQRLFRRLFRVERQDGSFLLIEKRSGRVVGLGRIAREGRLDPPFW